MIELNWLGLGIALLFMVLVKKYVSETKKKQPRSPPSLPIIGHLHMVKPPLHKTLHEISTKYGGDGVQMLRLGVRNVLLISSPSAVEECLVKNDNAFANRPDTLVGRLLHYNSTSMAFSPYNHHFRTLKRIMTQEVFSSVQIPRFCAIRQDEVTLYLHTLWRHASNKQVKVSLNKGFNEIALNFMTKMAAGKRYYGGDAEDTKQAKQFSDIIREGSVLSGAGNPVDFLPMFKWLFRGVEKDMVSWMEKTDAFYERLVDERKEMRNHDRTKPIIDVLLEAQQKNPQFFTNDVIKGMIMVLVLAGSDTSASTMEWAMSLLLNHPEALRKAVEEIDSEIGHDRLLNEDDLTKLPYLQSVINETLRLYPPTPLLLPHESSQDCTICGYNIPKGTMLMVSLWTIHRDPNNWNQPDKFIPERFDGMQSGELLYKLLPFGLGRRACPGYAMGKRAVGLVLGSLLQCFHWERLNQDLIDMSESSGITMPKALPLEALCKVRPSLANLLARQFDE